MSAPLDPVLPEVSVGCARTSSNCDENESPLNVKTSIEYCFDSMSIAKKKKKNVNGA